MPPTQNPCFPQILYKNITSFRHPNNININHVIFCSCFAHAEGPLSSFINYGMGRLRPLQNTEVYAHSELGIPLEACARKCLEEAEFQCLSFDYIFYGERSSCHISKYIAAHVRGLVVDTTNPRHNHFEKIGELLASQRHIYTHVLYSVAVLGF